MIENFVCFMDVFFDVMLFNVCGIYVLGIVVMVQEMYDVFVKVCGEEKLKFVREEIDEEVERLLKGWLQNVEFGNVKRIGLLFDEMCEQIFLEYVDSLK